MCKKRASIETHYQNQQFSIPLNWNWLTIKPETENHKKTGHLALKDQEYRSYVQVLHWVSYTEPGQLKKRTGPDQSGLAADPARTDTTL